MNEVREVHRVFLSTASDLSPLREGAEELVRRVNAIKAHSVGASLQLVVWEQAIPKTGRPQAQINEMLGQCSLAVFVLWRRWGTPRGQFSSGVEEEFEYVLANGIPALVYFIDDLEDHELVDPDAQLSQVLEFRNRIEAGELAMYARCRSIDAVRDRLLDDLCKWLDDIPIGMGESAAGEDDSEHRDEAERRLAELSELADMRQVAVEEAAAALLNEAAGHEAEGRVTRAEVCYAKAASVNANERTIYRFGFFLLVNGSPDRALEQFHRMDSVAQDAGNEYGRAVAKGSVAEALLQLGEPGRAEAALQDAIAICTEAELGELELHHKLALGQILLHTGATRRALESFDSGLALAEGDENSRMRAALLHERGKALFDLGSFTEAEESVARSLEIHLANADKAGEAANRHHLGLIAMAKGDLDGAAIQFGHSAAIERQLGRDRGVAVNLQELVGVELARGDVPAARALIDQEVALTEHSASRNARSASLRALGAVLAAEGSLGEAENRLREAERFASEAQWEFGVWAARFALTSVYSDMGRFEDAEDMLRGSIVGFEAAGQQSSASAARINLGLLLLYRGELERAAQAFEQAVERERELGSRSGEATCHSNLGLAYQQLDRLDDAEREFREALELAREMDAAGSVAKQLGNLANVELARRRPDRAEALLTEAAEIHATGVGAAGDRAAIEGARGHVYFGRGDVDAAAERYERALDGFVACGDARREAQARANLSLVAAARADWTAARELVVRARDQFQSMGDGASTSRMNERLTQLDDDQTNHE